MGVIDDYLTYLWLQGYSNVTIEFYSRQLIRFKSFCSKYSLSLADVTSKHALRFYYEISNSKSKSRTIQKRISNLRVFYRWMVQVGKIRLNPFNSLFPLAEPKELPASIQQTEIQRIYDIFDCFDYWSLRDILIFDLFYGCGVRPTELAELRPGDINLNQGYITVSRKVRRRIYQRDVPMLMSTNHRLRDYLRYVQMSESEYVFLNAWGNKMTLQVLRRIIHGFLKLVKTKKKNPFALRHSYASHLIRAGADLVHVKGLLGHQTVQSTIPYKEPSYSIMAEFKRAHPKA